MRVRVLTLSLLAALGVIATGAASARAASADAGEVGFLRNATSAFDPILVGSSPAERQWMAENYSRMRGYPPFFDRALGWAPRAQFYQDLYAIYNPSEEALIAAHPDWVLRDGDGRRLFIEYDCSGGSCPQYAADIGNPGWRAHWIAEARTQLEKGYGGIFIDDINLEMRVSDGNGQSVRPLDPRTGEPMTDADWRRYMAEFAEQIRAAFPEAEITHNPHWWLSHADPYVQRQVEAADVIELERGFNDRGIHGGGGTFGFETYLAHIDWLHARGKSVVLEPYNLDATSRVFELASYFLVSEGGDMIASDHLADPANFWSGWSTSLGAPNGGRYRWDGLLRRDFAEGRVLVNQPGAPSRTVELPAGFADLEGNAVDSVTLGARQGAVLMRDQQAGGGSGAGEQPVPEPEPAPKPNPQPEVDQTPDAELDVATDRASITLSPKRRRVLRGRRIVLLGSAPESVAVDIQRQRRGRGWRTVSSTTAEGESYSLTLRARRVGTHRFRALASELGASAPVRIRVR